MPYYSYNTNIPDGPNNPSADQPLMKQNTNSIDQILDVDLYGFGDNNGGYHQKSTYVDQTGSAPIAVAGTDIVFAQLANSLLELYMQRPAGSAVQLTSGTVAYVAGPVAGTGITYSKSGQSFIPGGFQVKFGKALITGSTATVVYTTIGLTNFPNNTLNVQIVPDQNNNNVWVEGTVTSSGFNFQTSGTPGALNFYWYAIGN